MGQGVHEASSLLSRLREPKTMERKRVGPELNTRFCPGLDQIEREVHKACLGAEQQEKVVDGGLNT